MTTMMTGVHGLVPGDRIVLLGVDGFSHNGKEYVISDVPASTTITIRPYSWFWWAWATIKHTWREMKKVRY